MKMSFAYVLGKAARTGHDGGPTKLRMPTASIARTARPPSWSPRATCPAQAHHIVKFPTSQTRNSTSPARKHTKLHYPITGCPGSCQARARTAKRAASPVPVCARCIVRHQRRRELALVAIILAVRSVEIVARRLPAPLLRLAHRSGGGHRSPQPDAAGLVQKPRHRARSAAAPC